LGLVERARQHATKGIELSRGINDAIFTTQNHYVLAFLALSQEDPADAIRHIEPLPDLLRGLGVVDPGVTPFQPDAVEALLLLARIEEAREIAQELSRVADELAHPWGRAASARVDALIASKEGTKSTPSAWPTEPSSCTGPYRCRSNWGGRC
jgi:hypothetical protein